MGGHDAGFDSFVVSDHFHPWFHTGAHSSFAWAVMAAMAVKSQRLVLGTSVTAPYLRYNPAIVAQAFSTLSYLAPGRIFLGLGTGEALNEVPVGNDWPQPHSERKKRLREATIAIRLLWTKEFVSFRGDYTRLRRANLYDKPPVQIPIHMAGVGPSSAELAGELADSFMTEGPADPTRLKEVLFPAVERGARSSGRTLEDLEKTVLLGLAFHADREKAIDSMLPWRGSMLPMFYEQNVSDPRYIEAHGNRMGRDAIPESVVATSADEVISRVEQHIELGFDHIVIAASGDFEGFMKVSKEKILPYLRGQYRDRAFNGGDYRGSYTTDNLEQLLEKKGLSDRVRYQKKR
jgi:coenzyme F420-dependent glucose-6-phosphate dehydrogenase